MSREKCRVSGKVVTWIPREDWPYESSRTVTCLCGGEAHFRVRNTDLPGIARILTHDAKNSDFREEQ